MALLAIIQPATLLLVAVGGMMGCVLRFLAINLIARLHPGWFPAGTIAVNVIGSLLIGIIMAKYGAQPGMRAFLVTGMLGGFTTFSAFSWDALHLLQRGQIGAALLYIGASVALSLAAVALGWQVVR